VAARPESNSGVFLQYSIHIVTELNEHPVESSTISSRSVRSLSPQPAFHIGPALQHDLTSWYPELAGRIRITLVEALPSVLPMFSKQLIDYTESTFKEEKIEILTKTMVKQVCVALCHVIGVR
jgi:hypothetical protein